MIWPVVEFVWLVPGHGVSYDYPRTALDSGTSRALLVSATVLALAGSVLLRRRPAAGFGLVVAGTVVSTAAWRQSEIPPPQFLAVDVALCFVAAVRPPRSSLGSAALALAVQSGYLVVRMLIHGGHEGTSPEPYMGLTVVIAWLVGNSVRQRRDHAEKLRAQAATQAATQAVTAERLRIARELHDMVAHSIGIIALQAGAARRVIDSQPAAARDALENIETAGRETLSGLRRMLGALRQAEPERRPQAAPSPGSGPGGLADVGVLARRTTDAGVRVDVRWLGEPSPLPPEIDMSAFRIVQEAVTNVVRHAGSDSCRVSIDRRGGEVFIEVVDSGHGDSVGGGARNGTGGEAGWGLAGMRERVALLHGEFTAGPRSGSGFRVAARLPVPAREAR
ncbi:histidine kinase [Streptomyces abyssalis]|uniref:histidine kinase n=2 Tax=Streptomyces abyssalis TaxID=933944 RepID=A0A1E7JTF3_9ACTN|nr:histidine kinase [Streptomyces abyssalis]OEU94372.1 histidine kinase [Streptomyces abyssalis]